ncbi:hypothetical protein PAMP_003373 [Pampus punctatissimus]
MIQICVRIERCGRRSHRPPAVAANEKRPVRRPLIGAEPHFIKVFSRQWKKAFLLFQNKTM